MGQVVRGDTIHDEERIKLLNKIRSQIEEINDRLDHLDNADFNENDENAASYIKNRPFYDYDKITNNLIFKTEQFDSNIYRYGQGTVYNGAILGININNIDDITLCILDYSDRVSDIINFNKLLNCRYKINKNDSQTYNQRTYYSLVNYYNEEPLAANIADYNVVRGPYKVYCCLTDAENAIRAISYEGHNSRLVDGTVTYQQKDYVFTKFYCLDVLEYYEGYIETEHRFKSLDEKYIPNSLIQRIEACEQALNITPNP